MLLDALIAVIPPPRDPYEAGSFAQWGTVRERIGEVLPEDYCQFVQHYGTGVIGGWLNVLNPFAKNPRQNLLVGAFENLATLRELPGGIPGNRAVPVVLRAGRPAAVGKLDRRRYLLLANDWAIRSLDNCHYREAHQPREIRSGVL
jgi:hypothetical protein